MKNPYYLIWSNTILNFKKYNPKSKNWKIVTISYITWMQALNLWVITLWLKYFDVFTLPFIDIDIFPGDDLDGFLSFAATFALPFIPINYLLIFFRDRYKKFVEKYDQLQPNYAVIYMSASVLLALFTAFVYGALTM